MSDTATTFLLTWLLLWVVVTATYAAMMLGLDALLTAHRRRQQARRRHQAELDRLNRDTAAAVQRIGAAFVLAQQLIRDEAAASWAGHR